MILYDKRGKDPALYARRKLFLVCARQRGAYSIDKVIALMYYNIMISREGARYGGNKKMTFWQEFALVFSEIGWAAAICLIVGLIFIVVEIFQPGFGFFGITGSVLVIVGIVIRVYNHGGGNPIIQLFILLAVVMLVLVAAFTCMVFSMKRGYLSRTGFVNKDTAVSVGRTAGTADYDGLVGKEGVTLCALRPAGSVKIDDKVYDVVSNAMFIAKDCKVVVDYVEGGKIVVKIKE